jgi:hypothetical protein
MYVKKTWCEDVEWIRVIQDSDAAIKSFERINILDLWKVGEFVDCVAVSYQRTTLFCGFRQVTGYGQQVRLLLGAVAFYSPQS